jgi:hypothetical protein
MHSSRLNNLAKIGQLKVEPYSEQEYCGLIRFGVVRLQDALSMKDM